MTINKNQIVKKRSGSDKMKAVQSVSHANAPLPFWLVKRAQNAAGAALTGGFFALNSALPVRPGGRVRIRFEARNLVLRFYLEETRNARRLSVSCLRNNIVEAFIDTKHDHESYYHLVLNMLGECSMERVLRGNKARNWHCAVKTALSLTGDVWTADMQIPLAGLGVKTARPGGVWGLNFVRTRFLKFGDFHYSSAAPGLPCFRCPGLSAMFQGTALKY
ncbi:MAG: hypothetical protein PHP98_01775 [Kiritimatiellae bacterium]|nr:hypothetical protein [Kiritimatiellia bacterium]